MFDLTLSPAQVELLAKPGATITQGFDVTNNSSSAITVNTFLRPWQPIGTAGQVSYTNVLPNPNFDFSLANSDIQLGQSFILKPGEKRQLVLKIKSTTGAPLTDTYYTLFVSQSSSNSLNPNQIGAETTAEIGSNLLLSTSDTENPTSKASFSRFTATPRLKDIFFSRVTFTGLINNDSDHFFKTDGKIIISKNGLTLQELTLFPRNVLANYSRQIDCLQDNEPAPCAINPPFWPGVYTATIQANSTSSSVSFFIFPLSPVILITLIALSIAIWVKLFSNKATH